MPMRFVKKRFSLNAHKARVDTADCVSGMVSMMDESFGNITRALEAKGLLDNALLVFTTDVSQPLTSHCHVTVTTDITQPLTSHCHVLVTTDITQPLTLHCHVIVTPMRVLVFTT